MTEASSNERPSLPAAPTSGDTGGRPSRSNAAMFGFLGGLIGGIAAAALAAGAIVASWPMLRANLVSANEPKPAVIEELNRRIGTLEAAASRPIGESPDLAQLKQRVATLEQAPPTVHEDPRVTALAEKTDRLADQVGKLNGASGDAAEMEKLVTRAEAAAQSAHDSAAKRQSAEALLIVAGQLRDAIERGGPYAAELAAARKVAPPSAGPALDALIANAETGVQRQSQLVESFPAVAAAVTRTSLIPAPNNGFWDRLEHEAATLVSVRRVDGQGSDAASAAARAEKALRAGDLFGAVRELGALDGAPAEAAKTWLTAARARLAAEQGLADLTAATAAVLNGGDG
jgi:hypothetical protein